MFLLLFCKTHLQHLDMRNFHRFHRPLHLMMAMRLRFPQTFRLLEDIVEDIPLFDFVIITGCG